MSPAEIVERCQKVLAHAWMVRTFIKHCEEVEDFPELMGIVRAVFDTCLAVETRLEQPEDYFRMLRAKLKPLRRAADQFRIDAPLASTHTNFKQAVISVDFCIAQLTELLDIARSAQGSH